MIINNELFYISKGKKYSIYLKFQTDFLNNTKILLLKISNNIILIIYY